MNGYKIVKLYGNQYGDCQYGFVIDGKVKNLPYVGNVWKQDSNGWSRKLAVVESKVAGLLCLEYGRSKVAKPLALAQGEVYLPISVTGRSMFFKALPE